MDCAILARTQHDNMHLHPAGAIKASFWPVVLEDCACLSKSAVGVFQPQLPMTAPAITFFSNLNLDNFSCFIPKITLRFERATQRSDVLRPPPHFCSFLVQINRSTSTRSRSHHPLVRLLSLNRCHPNSFAVACGTTENDCYRSKNVSVCSYPGAQLQRKTSSSPPVFRIV